MSETGDKISELPAASALQNSNPVVVVQGPPDALVTARSTVGAVAEAAVPFVTVTGFGDLGATRSYSAKLSDIPLSNDYKGLTQPERIAAGMAMLEEAGGGILTVPATPVVLATYQPPPLDVLLDFAGPMVNRAALGGGGTVNFRSARLARHAGPHDGTRTTTQAITTYAVGSGRNGAPHADVALELSVDKENWSNPNVANAGEIDGLIINARQGGPITGEKSALGGMVIGTTITKGTGFVCIYEGVSRIVDPDAALAVTHEVNIKTGALDGRDESYQGIVLSANKGVMEAAIRIQTSQSTGADWGLILDNYHKSLHNFWITADAEIVWNPPEAGDQIRLTAKRGPLEVLAEDDSALFAVDDQSRLLSEGTPWASGETIVLNDVRVFTAGVYRCMLGGVSTVQPTDQSGVQTTADGLQWLFVNEGSSAPFARGQNGSLMAWDLRVISAQGSYNEGRIGMVAGSPQNQFVAPQGSLALRNNGGAGRSLYVKETGADASGWAAALTDTLVTSISAAGNTQATATTLTGRVNVVSSVPNPATANGVILSANRPDEQIVLNRGGATLTVYPPVGAQIEALGTDNPTTIAASGFARFVRASSTQFYLV